MSFLLLPPDSPSQIVSGHPREEVISDVLGGAIPVPICLPNGGCALFVRETAADEGLNRNILASVVAALFGAGPGVILGPAVLTTVYWGKDEVGPVGTAECFPPDAVNIMMEVLGDLQRALDGYDTGFAQALLEQEPGWPARVRRAGEAARTAPIRPDWPGVHRVARDPLADLLRRGGLGQQFAPIRYP